MHVSPEEKREMFKNNKRISIYQATHFEYVRDEVLLQDDKIYNYDIIIHPGASVMIPIDDDGGIFFVKQYRPPIDQIIFELPAGKIDHNEDPKETAIRELQEEIGKYPGSIEKIFEMAPAPSYTTEVLHFYLAKDLRDQSLPQDHLEALEVAKFSLEEAVQMVKNGEIIDGKTALGILYYEKIH